LDAEADQFVARDDFEQLAPWIQATTPNKCLHCRQPTIWLVTVNQDNPRLWHDRIIEAAEQHTRFRDPPKVCPCLQCRAAVNGNKGHTTWARSNLSPQARQKVLDCLRQNRDEFDLFTHLNKRKRKKQDPIELRKRKRRQQLKAARAHIYPFTAALMVLPM
jgi:hypothetical protein